MTHHKNVSSAKKDNILLHFFTTDILKLSFYTHKKRHIFPSLFTLLRLLQKNSIRIRKYSLTACAVWIKVAAPPPELLPSRILVESCGKKIIKRSMSAPKIYCSNTCLLTLLCMNEWEKTTWLCLVFLWIYDFIFGRFIYTLLRFPRCKRDPGL